MAAARRSNIASSIKVMVMLPFLFLIAGVEASQRPQRHSYLVDPAASITRDDQNAAIHSDIQDVAVSAGGTLESVGNALGGDAVFVRSMPEETEDMAAGDIQRTNGHHAVKTGSNSTMMQETQRVVRAVRANFKAGFLRSSLTESPSIPLIGIALAIALGVVCLLYYGGKWSIGTYEQHKKRTTVKSQLDWHPVVGSHEDFFNCIKLVKAKKLQELGTPWPRSQDLPERCFKKPTSEDLTFAVSHGWPYQAHPDPLGLKAKVLEKLLKQAIKAHNPHGDTVGFLDYCSVSQRPFREGQAERTAQQTQNFSNALKAMPSVYRLVDVVIHLDMEWTAIPDDGELIDVNGSDLKDATLLQLGPNVQVMSHDLASVRLFDFIHSVDGVTVEGNLSVEDIEKKLQSAHESGVPSLVRLKRSPMGKQNQILTGERGWVYLERFATMVKLAMVEECEFDRVCFSNSEAVLSELKEGGRTLRNAAKEGDDELRRVLGEFAKVLDTKKFSATSTDKAKNTGGCSGEAVGEEPEKPPPKAASLPIAGAARAVGYLKSMSGGMSKTFGSRKNTSEEMPGEEADFVPSKAEPLLATGDETHTLKAPQSGDREIVYNIMQEMVQHLSDHWHAESRSQNKRQLLLAVARNDAASCAASLATGADPNFRGSRNTTYLHLASSHRALDVVQALKAGGADCLLEDDDGNCAAHVLGLFTDELTVSLFRELTQPGEILGKANEAGVRPIDRLFFWARSAGNGAPYAPAMQYLDTVFSLQPELRPQIMEIKHAHSVSYPQPQCSHQSNKFIVGPYKVKEELWRPSQLEGEPRIHIVCFISPWYFQTSRPAFAIIAEACCVQQQATIHLLEMPLLQSISESHQLMGKILGAMHLTAPVILMDHAAGSGVGALSTLHQHLSGMVLINPQGFWADEFLNSPSHKAFKKTISGAATAFRIQDTQEISNFWLTHSLVTAQKQARDEVQGVCMAALQKWESSDFEKAATWMEWISEAHSQSFPSSYESMEELPITIVLGAYAPSSIFKSANRIQRAFSQANTVFIPGGGINFELEGEDQVKMVAEELVMMMKEVLSKAESRPQRHWNALKAAARLRSSEGQHVADPENGANPFPAGLNAFGRNKRTTVGRIQDNSRLHRQHSTLKGAAGVSPKPKSAQFQELSSPHLPLGSSVTLLDAQSMLEAGHVNGPILEVSEPVDEPHSPLNNSDTSGEVTQSLRTPSLRATRGQQQARQAVIRNSPPSPQK
jgi:hypothetical protein